MDFKFEKTLDDEVVPLENQQKDLANYSDAENDEDISFEDLGLDEKSLAAIERKGFVTPSPIQVLAIPRLLNGDANIIARARTGTGKTAAFGLPIIQSLRDKPGSVRALILEPTRELAVQTCTEMQSFTEGKVPRTCVLYGGASYSTQIRDLRKGCEIVAGTPGRIQDHLERGTLDISSIDYFILDEGDEMLDMGFIDDIEAIFEKANPNCRILIFSATMPEPILKIAQKFMGDYEVIEEDGVIDEPLLIDQKFWVVRDNEKIDALVRLVDMSDDFYGLVFTQTKNDADFVSRILEEKGYGVAALHGDIPQAQREKILARFRNKKISILVATDVAARGIDISGLSHVVNYSLPFDGATYVHRIGRTGRAGTSGIAVTFVCPSEGRKLSFLQRAVRKASKGEMKEENVPSVEQVVSKRREVLFSNLKSKLGLDQPALDNAALTETDEAQEVLSAASYSSENAENKTSSLKKASFEFEKLADELCLKNEAKDVLASVLSVLYADKLDKARYGKIQGRGSNSNQTRIYVQLGRKDGYNPRGIAEFFTNLLHISDRQVDRIDVSSNFSLVSLPKDAARKALDLSKRGGNVPHMHIDTKDGNSFSFDDRKSFGRDFSRRSSRGFGGKRNSDGSGRSGFSGRGRAKGNRPNFHTQSERSGASQYKKSGAKAERF